MDKPDASWSADFDESQNISKLPVWRKSIFRGAWLLGAWILFLGILVLISSRGLDQFVSSCAKGHYGKLGTGAIIFIALMIIFPPFFSAGNFLIGCFEAATGRPFREIESWFQSLSWPRKCLVAPLMAAPLAVVALGLIWFGAVVVKKLAGGS